MYQDKESLEIEGFKKWEGSYEIIDSIRKFILNAELDGNHKNIAKGIRMLITESAPYNVKWEDELESFDEEVSKLYDEKYYDKNGKLKDSVNIKKEFFEEKQKFLSNARKRKAVLLVKFSKSRLIPFADYVELERWELEEDPIKREELKALRDIGIK